MKPAEKPLPSNYREEIHCPWCAKHKHKSNILTDMLGVSGASIKKCHSCTRIYQFKSRSAGTIDNLKQSAPGQDDPSSGEKPLA